MTEMPVEFENRMKEMLGNEYNQFRASYDDTKKTGIRVNTLKISVKEFTDKFPYELTPVPWCDTGFAAGTDEKYGRNALHDAGAFYMQEPSAMAVAASVASVCNLKGAKILDLCAAPGGKSTQFAAYLGGMGLLISNEINRERAGILSSNIERMGVKNAIVLNETPANIAERFEEFFDVVAVDAPCSGEGMFRKDETAIKEWSPSNVTMCAERQKDILDEAVKTVAPGGLLVYSTCTFAPAEDEEQILDFLERYPEFEAIEVPGFKYFEGGLKIGSSDYSKENVESDELKDMSDKEDILKKCARLWPHKIDGEGHFICIMKRTGINPITDSPAKESIMTDESEPAKESPITGVQLKSSDKYSVSKGKKNKSAEKNRELRADKKSNELINSFIKENLADFEYDRDKTVSFGDSVYLLPEGFDVSLKGLKVVRCGLCLGEIKKDRFEPSHSLAMALMPEKVLRYIDLNEDEALKFRHGEELRKEAANGWTLICTDDVSLGWAKAVNGSLKNHYPKGLRIKY